MGFDGLSSSVLTVTPEQLRSDVSFSVLKYERILQTDLRYLYLMLIKTLSI